MVSEMHICCIEPLYCMLGSSGEMHSGAGLVYRDALHTLMHIETHSGYSKVSIEVEQ